MSGSEHGDGAHVSIESSGSISGHSVQAGEIHGDVHFHQGAEQMVVPRQLPAAVRHFVNRAAEQDGLTTLLNGASTDGVVLISTIDGIGGVGKSTLVVQWAHRVRERFPDGELCVNLRGFDPAAEPMTSTDALEFFLAALGIPPEKIPASLDARASLYRTLLHGKKMLIVLDNARSTEQVRSLLPGSSTSLVLVTSRNRLEELRVREGARRMTLEVLDQRESRELFGRYLGEVRVRAEPDAVDTVIGHCAGLPLALGIVAVQAAESPDYPLDDVAAELQDERERLDALDAGGETGVRAVFSWSYHSLSASAARLFRLLGLPTGPDISLAAATSLAGLSPRETRKALSELTRTNLIEQHDGRYRFHDLLRAYAAECAFQDESDEERGHALRRLLDHYLRTSFAAEQQLAGDARKLVLDLPASEVSGLQFSDGPQAMRWWEAERANLSAAVRQAGSVGLAVHSWQLTYTLMYFFHLRNHTADWLEALDIGLVAARQLGDRQGEAHLLADLGIAHFDAGQYDNAGHALEQALALFEGSGDRHREGMVLITLGEAHIELQQYDQATDALRRGVEVQRRIGDHNAQGAAHSGLGLVHSALRKFDEAIGQYEEALRLFSEGYGTGFALNGLAEAHFDAGHTDEARHTYRRAVAHRREIGHRKGEAVSLRGLGVTLHLGGDIDGARESWQQAAEIFDELGLAEADEVRALVG